MNVHTRSVGGSLTEYHLVGTAERTIFPSGFRAVSALLSVSARQSSAETPALKQQVLCHVATDKRVSDDRPAAGHGVRGRRNRSP